MADSRTNIKSDLAKICDQIANLNTQQLIDLKILLVVDKSTLDDWIAEVAKYNQVNDLTDSLPKPPEKDEFGQPKEKIIVTEKEVTVDPITAEHMKNKNKLFFTKLAGIQKIISLFLQVDEEIRTEALQSCREKANSEGKQKSDKQIGLEFGTAELTEEWMSFLSDDEKYYSPIFLAKVSVLFSILSEGMNRTNGDEIDQINLQNAIYKFVALQDYLDQKKQQINSNKKTSELIEHERKRDELKKSHNDALNQMEQEYKKTAPDQKLINSCRLRAKELVEEIKKENQEIKNVDQLERKYKTAIADLLNAVDSKVADIINEKKIAKRVANIKSKTEKAEADRKKAEAKTEAERIKAEAKQKKIEENKKKLEERKKLTDQKKKSENGNKKLERTLSSGTLNPNSKAKPTLTRQGSALGLFTSFRRSVSTGSINKAENATSASQQNIILDTKNQTTTSALKN